MGVVANLRKSVTVCIIWDVASKAKEVFLDDMLFEGPEFLLSLPV